MAEEVLYKEVFLSLSETDKSKILSRLSDDLLEQNISEQIATKIIENLTPTNFLSIFNDRYNLLIEKYKDQKDLVGELNRIKNYFYNNTKNAIEEKFDIQTNLNIEYDLSSIKKIYEFFVIYYRENLIKYCTNYVLINKPELVKVYRNSTNKKDLGVTLLRKNLIEFDDVVLIHNIQDIITNIYRNHNDSQDILEIVISDDENESISYAIKELFIDGKYDSTLGIHFAKKFLSPLDDEQYNFELMNEVKIELVKSLPKK
jgi:hypothetical protein